MHREETTALFPNNLTIFGTHFIITQMGEILSVLPKMTSNVHHKAEEILKSPIFLQHQILK